MKGPSRLFGVVMLLVAGLTCDQKEDSASSSPADETTLATGQPPQPDYSKIGWHHGATPCGTSCNGYLPAKPESGSISKEDADRLWRSFRPANKGILLPRRKKQGSGGPPARQAVEAVEGAERIALKDLPREAAQIIAVLRVGVNSSEDERYGLSDATAKGFDGNRVYVVAHDFDISNPTENDGSNPQVSSRRVARWSLWAIRRVGGGGLELVKLAKSGWIRWCGHPHADDTRKSFAVYTQCDQPDQVLALKDDAAVMRALDQYVAGRDSLVEGLERGSFGWLASALLAFDQEYEAQSTAVQGTAPEVVRVIQDAVARLFDPDAPAWFVCGVGCCIADT